MEYSFTVLDKELVDLELEKRAKKAWNKKKQEVTRKKKELEKGLKN